MPAQILVADWIRLLPYAIPVFVVVMILRRNMRPRPLRPERLWITPLLITLAAGMALFATPPPKDILSILILVASLALGGLLGWYRGRVTQMTVDPVTHAVTVQVSPLASVLILGIVALRYGLRSLSLHYSAFLHLSAIQAADALLLLATGMICVQRLELWLRATRLRREIREAPQAPVAADSAAANPATPVTPPAPPIVQ